MAKPNWIQQQIWNFQDAARRIVRPVTDRVGAAVQPVARTAAVVAPVATRAGAERVVRRVQPAADTIGAAAQMTAGIARSPAPVIAAVRDHAAKTEAAEVQRWEKRQAVQEQMALSAMQMAGAVAKKGKEFIESPPARIGSMFAGERVGRKIDVLAAPARAIKPTIPSYEEHFARHPEDLVKGAVIGASIAIPAGAVGGTIARGGAMAAGRATGKGAATNIIRTGGGGAGHVTLAETSIENVIKFAGPAATLIGASQWGRSGTRMAGEMPTGMPDWMNDWSNPHGNIGYAPDPELEVPDITDRGERYPGEDFSDYLRYRDELARREGPVRREGPIPYYRGPEIISGGRTIRSPEMQPGEGILRSPELPTGGRTIRSPEIENVLEPRQARPELLLPRDGPTLPTDLFAESAITRTPPRTWRAPTREIVDDGQSRYIFGYDWPTLAPAREVPDPDILSRDMTQDVDVQFGSALSPPRPAALPRFSLEARLQSRDRLDSLPEFDASPLSFPGTKTEAGTRAGVGTRAGTATGTRTGTKAGTKAGTWTGTDIGTINDIANKMEFKTEYPRNIVEMPTVFETVIQPPRPGDRRRLDLRRRDKEEKRKKKKKRSKEPYDWIVENPVHDIESVFGIGPPKRKKR